MYQYDLHTNKLSRLTQKRNLDYFPFVSRTGGQVYFGDEGKIWSVDFLTGEERIVSDATKVVGHQITKASGCFESYDGNKLVNFFESPNEYGLVVTELSSGKSEVVVRGSQPVRHCQFCPVDNNLVLYAHEGSWETIRTRMWLLDLVNGESRPVGNQDRDDQVGHEFWAQTEKRVYYTLYRPNGVSEIRTYSVDANKDELFMQLENCHVAIGPHDKRMVADNNRGSADQLFLISVSERKAEVVAYPRMSWTNGRFHPHPTFDPSGAEVVFTSDVEGQAAVYLINVA